MPLGENIKNGLISCRQKLSLKLAAGTILKNYPLLLVSTKNAPKSKSGLADLQIGT